MCVYIFQSVLIVVNYVMLSRLAKPKTRITCNKISSTFIPTNQKLRGSSLWEDKISGYVTDLRTGKPQMSLQWFSTLASESTSCSWADVSLGYFLESFCLLSSALLISTLLKTQRIL